MNEYQPQQYYGYYPAQYVPMGPVTTGIMTAVMVIALIAWAISLIRRAIKGEPVEPPSYYPPA